MLWSEAVAAGYSAPIWMTFRQARELGGTVRKGEHGTTVVYASTFHKTEANAETGEELERDIPFMKGYTVFNVDQIEGLPEQYYALAKAPEMTPQERIAVLEEFFANTNVNFHPNGASRFRSNGATLKC